MSIVDAGVRHPRTALAHELARSIPTGYGRHGRLSLSADQLDGVLTEGVPYLVRTLGLGTEEDLPCIEAGGHLPGARADKVTLRARERGHDQLGTLGGGNVQIHSGLKE